MKKWIIIVPFFVFSCALFANNNTSDQQASAMNCNSKKIETCMTSCVKRINPSSVNASAASKINKCADTCGTQGCQMVKK